MGCHAGLPLTGNSPVLLEKTLDYRIAVRSEHVVSFFPRVCINPNVTGACQLSVSFWGSFPKGRTTPPALGLEFAGLARIQANTSRDALSGVPIVAGFNTRNVRSILSVYWLTSQLSCLI